jgi:hypothetical protein
VTPRRLPVARLGEGVGAVEEEDGDLLIGLAAGVDGAMNAVPRRVPVDLPGCDLGAMARAPPRVLALARSKRFPIEGVDFLGTRVAQQQR